MEEYNKIHQDTFSDMRKTFFLIQQFITRGARAARGSYFVTTLHRI